MLMRFDPIREFDRFAQMLGQSTDVNRKVFMPMDAYRSGDELIAHFDLPGVDRDEIGVTVERNSLTVEATRTWEAPEDSDVIVAERFHGQFRRHVYLGDALDSEQIEADYTDGVLTLKIPIAQQAKPRKISITSGQRELEAATSS